MLKKVNREHLENISIMFCENTDDTKENLRNKLLKHVRKLKEFLKIFSEIYQTLSIVWVKFLWNSVKSLRKFYKCLKTWRNFVNKILE